MFISNFVRSRTPRMLAICIPPSQPTSSRACALATLVISCSGTLLVKKKEVLLWSPLLPVPQVELLPYFQLISFCVGLFIFPIALVKAAPSPLCSNPRVPPKGRLHPLFLTRTHADPHQSHSLRSRGAILHCTTELLVPHPICKYKSFLLPEHSLTSQYHNQNANEMRTRTTRRLHQRCRLRSSGVLARVASTHDFPSFFVLSKETERGLATSTIG